MAQKSRRRLLSLIDQAVKGQPLNKAFLTDVMSAIEQKDLKGRRKPSKYYKPSSFICLRQMYFMRTEQEPDEKRNEYNSIGMADTGTRRHEAIQEVLTSMEKMGYDWRYVDVEEYLKTKWEQGKCLNLEIREKRGAETKLFDKVLNMSFMCDGIIQRISTGNYYLFEFKNQISFKYACKGDVDEEHKHQVACYCMELDLEYAFVLYENRDTCELECPVLFKVTPEMRQAPIDKIFECESYVERLVPPPKHSDSKPCRWCNYQLSCRKVGN